jgi:predicted HicB family RNase H-like nuclease
MAIAKKPDSNPHTDAERKAVAFISKAGQEPKERIHKKPTLIRIPPELLKRIDQGAERLGISRAAFVVQSAAEKLERMDSQ